MDIIYFVDNKLGGVTSLNYNLAANPQPDCRQTVIHIDQKEWDMSRSDVRFPVDKEIHFNYTGMEHSYATLKRLYKLTPKVAGAMILNYENEMALLDHYSFPQTTFQLIHDDYNLNLAKKYGHVSDVFICHNTIIHKKLLELFPLREKAIFYLPHGVRIPANYRKPTNEEKPLQLLFLGRMAASKGIFDLPLINDLLRQKNIKFEWTCIGNGPDLEELKKQWNAADKVEFISPQTNAEVLEICASKDVFVLPTKFEGSPVSLLETMSTGLVPVISKLPGGITDLVTNDIGFSIPVNDNVGFAEAIEKLYHDRSLLDLLSKQCREKIIADFNIEKTAASYHALFSRYKEFYKPRQHKRLRIGARLDHPIIPGYVSLTIRRIIKHLK